MARALKRTQRKPGTFSPEVKTAPQQEFRRRELSRRAERDELTDIQKEMVQARRALTPTTRKTKDSERRQPYDTALFDDQGQLFGQLQGAKNIYVRDFLGSETPTGVVARRDIDTGLSRFAENVGKLVGVTKVEQVGSGPTAKFDISRDYQQARFRFDPKALALKTEGWSLDIPDEYIRVSDTKIVAPDQEYRAELDRVTRYGDRRRDDKHERFDTFTPTEILLTPDAKRIQQITRQDVYTPEYRDDVRRDRFTQFERQTPYVTEVQRYFDTGFLQDLTRWGDYTTQYRSEWDRDRDVDRREERRDIYKTDKFIFNPYGNLESYKHWDWYYGTDERDTTRGIFERQRGQVFLKREEERDVEGRLRLQREFEPYVTYAEDVRYPGMGRTRYTERDDTLTKETVFDAGRPLQRLRLGLADVRQAYDEERAFEEDDLGRLRELIRRQETGTGFSDLVFRPVQVRRREQVVVPESIEYFDPVTGEIVEREVLR